MADTRRNSGSIKGATTVHPSYDLGKVKFAPFAQPVLSKPGSADKFKGADGRPVSGMSQHAIGPSVPFNTRKARNTGYDANFNEGNAFAKSRKTPYDPNTSVK
jgi:hypothetical protein